MFDAVDPNTRRLRDRSAESGASLRAARPPAGDHRLLLRASTAPTRSPAAAGSSTGRRTSATRWRRRRGRTTTASRSRRPSSTRSPTSGSATPSPPRPGPTSGSTRASPPSRSGSTTRGTAGTPAADTFDELYAIPEDDPAFEDLWFPAPAALHHPSELFHTPVYDRGGMTLQALREKVGDPIFFGILRDWYAENRIRQRRAPPTSSLSPRERASRTWTTSSRSGSTRRAGRRPGEGRRPRERSAAGRRTPATPGGVADIRRLLSWPVATGSAAGCPDQDRPCSCRCPGRR